MFFRADASLAVFYFIAGFAMPLVCVYLGQHVYAGVGLAVFGWRHPASTIVSPLQRAAEAATEAGVAVLTVLITAGAVLSAGLVRQNGAQLGVALALAAPGALLRFSLARRLGAVRGTFTANITGTALTSLAFRLGKSAALAGTPGGAAVLAVGTGFAGALSTVSSTFADLVAMDDAAAAYRYGIVTLVCAQAVASIVNAV